MKIITVEEHFGLPAVHMLWDRYSPETKALYNPSVYAFLEDFGDGRIEHMDKLGIDVQVLSLASPGLEVLDKDDAVRLARESNEAAARAVATHPERFQAFATIPTQAASAACDELKRCVEELGFRALLVNGHVGDRNIDHPDFFPIFETAAKLKIPVAIHPTLPQAPIFDIYYEGFDQALSDIFQGPAIGWHYETGIQAMRLILARVFDRLPDLQIILGHWGEVLFSYAERVDEMFELVRKGKLDKSVMEYFKSNFYLHPSGVYHPRMMRDAIDVVGVDRILWSVDYPFVIPKDGVARQFLLDSGLPQADKEKIASGNWERLTSPS